MGVGSFLSVRQQKFEVGVRFRDLGDFSGFQKTQIFWKCIDYEGTGGLGVFECLMIKGILPASTKVFCPTLGLRLVHSD